MRNLTTILLFFLISLAASADDRYETRRDISYTEKTDSYSRERLKLDVHYPVGVSGKPVIVWFHGGGLTGGNKEIPEELKEQGFVVIAPNYRLIPNVGVNECIDDAAEAVA